LKEAYQKRPVFPNHDKRKDGELLLYAGALSVGRGPVKGGITVPQGCGAMRSTLDGVTGGKIMASKKRFIIAPGQLSVPIVSLQLKKRAKIKPVGAVLHL
jgi:hypothetical protein